MVWSGHRFRDLAVETYLWGQRCKLPLPRVARRIGRKAFARQVDQMIPDRTDEWGGPFHSAVRGCVGVRSLSTDPALCEVSTPSPASIPRLLDPARLEVPSRLRCVVATGTLKLGGQEMVALFLARGLQAYGLDAVVAHTPWGRPDEETVDSLRLDGVPVVKLALHNVEEWLATYRPDVISIHGASDWLVTAAAAARIPIVETLHGADSLFDRGTWRRERFRSRHIAGFVAVSELVRRQYLRSNPGYPPDRVITIPNGVDGQHIGHRDRAQARAWLGLGNEFLFVSLARYHIQKNTFGLVAAFSDVVRAYPETRLLCAGDVAEPSYFEQVRNLRDGLPCAGQIRLCGPCPDVSGVLAAADAFVLDSFFEGWSMASMEAIYTGLPAILSEVSGAREQVGQNGRRGLIVENPLGDPEATDWRRIRRMRFRCQVNRSALVEAMCTVIAERDRWRSVRDELRAEAMDLFSVDLCVQRHAEVLTRAAASAASRE
jgi:glycosyltransferase involved in cell wall biosynthesis